MSLKNFHSLVLKRAPRWDVIDRLISFIDFALAHHRLPRARLSFNDYLYRIKTSDQIENPLRVFVTDKEYVKLYVKAVVGDQFNVPTLAVLTSAAEAIRFAYPEVCCIKPTHLSGEVILRAAGGEVNFATIERWFSQSHYHVTRERNYRALRPKLIVEPIVFGDMNVMDYKIFCFNGKARLVQIDLDRRNGHKRKFFDREWMELPFSLAFPRYEGSVACPRNLDQMLVVAEALAAPFDFVRVDLYSDGDLCFVGEITNCHGNAGESFIPKSAEGVASKIIFGEGSCSITGM